MRHILFYDIETYSEVSLDHGTCRYAEEAEVMIVTWAVDDGEVQIWDRTGTQKDPPAALLEAWNDPDYWIVSNNTWFDRTVTNATRLLPEVPVERWFDTMVQAFSHGLPGSLDKLSTIYGLSDTEAKMKEGRSLIHLFCKPNRGKRIHAHERAMDWMKFRDYAMRDITTMRILHHKMPKWNYPGRDYLKGSASKEHGYWCLDQRINDRGFALDTELCEAAVITAENEKTSLNARTHEATDGDVEKATQRDAILQHIMHAYGVELPDLKADTVKRRISDESLPIELRTLLELRLASSRNSAAKYKSALKSVSADGRIRGGLQFCGAQTTGRDSGRIIQPQNFMRPTLKPEVINIAIEDIKAGNADLLYDNMAEVLGNCIRGVIVAAPGKKIISCDLSSVEGRMLAWLAGEDDIIDFYRQRDAGLVDYDSYMLAYGRTFAVDPPKVTKDQRQIGKPIELGLGYGGGVSAFLTFALTYYLEIPEIADAVYSIADGNLLHDCESMYEWAKNRRLHGGLPQREYAACEYIKRRWRESRPHTVAFWKQLDQAFRMATTYPDETFDAGSHIKMRRTGQWLRIRLPSGRNLNFLQPKVTEKGISYMGLDRYTHRWTRQYTHGGKIAGWVTQAAAACLLREAYRDAEEDDCPVVMRVHDELIVEVPDEPEFDVARIAGHLTRERSGFKGLPLAADGFEAYRYRKDG